MKILLAGPGTGKTTNIKKIITQHGDGSKFLVLSFTNTTVGDLQNSLEAEGISDQNCMTLHKFAVKYNHDRSRHVLLNIEENELETISKGTGIGFDKLCDFLMCTTFDQMIERFVGFARSNPLYLKNKLNAYDTLIVDEYQDFNPSEQSLIDILIETIRVSYVLGDDDQCIYDFKDASSDKIISFYNDVNNERINHEHVCHRCPDKVVEHATNLIGNNKKRVTKEWKKSGKPGTIKYYQLKSFNDVSRAIYAEIKKLKNETILILSPVGFAIAPLVKLLNENGIKFANLFSERIPDSLIIKSWEVKSIFGGHNYLNLVLLGYTVLSARKKYYATIKKHFDNGQNIDELFKLLTTKLPDNLIDNKLGLEEFLSKDSYLAMYNLYYEAIGDSPEERLENMFRTSSIEEEQTIRIMSIHKSKGLGAEHVFIVGLNEGILPNRKRGNDSIESQRRLFYVGMTRAKKQLFLYSNVQIEGKYVNRVNKEDFVFEYKSRLWNGKASTFINELHIS